MAPLRCLLVLLSSVAAVQAQAVNGLEATALEEKTFLDIHLSEEEPWCSLYDAVEHNDLPSVQICLRQHYIKEQLELKRGPFTPLMKAAQIGNFWMVHALLQAGARIEVNGNETAAIHLAGTAEVARLLLDRGANINARDQDGCTPLHYAANRGTVEVAGILLEMGANSRIACTNGHTPIHEASFSNNVEIVRMLLDRGEDVDRRGFLRFTPLMRAARNGSVAVARLLLEKGANSSLRSDLDEGAIHIASMFNHVGIVRILLEFDDNVDMDGFARCTPLFVAARYGSIDLVRLLLEKGADKTIHNAFGDTALDVAKESSSERTQEEMDILEKLLS